jgi:polyisoprenoid-binding protein YceI
MADQTRRRVLTRRLPGRSARKRHWWRWLLAGIAALIVLVVVAIGVFIKLQPTLPPLALPTARASAPTGPIDGMWATSARSVAGFRIQESGVGMSNDVVGRTNAITGTVDVADGRVTRAAFRINLTAIRVNGKVQRQFATSLGTRDHPVATFRLAQPVTLSRAFTSGAAVTLRVTGYLAMHGTSHPVTATISARRDGPALQAAGSIPIALSRWGIEGPGGFGFFGSLASHGVAEFLLNLRRR